MATNMNQLLGTPATSFIQGEQAGIQNRLAQSAEQRAQQSFGMNRQKSILDQEISSETLKQLKEQGGLKNSIATAKRDAVILNSVSQLPESQRQAGLEAVQDQLHPNTKQLFTAPDGRTVYDPNRAKMVFDMAGSLEKTASKLQGKVLEGTNSKGQKVFFTFDKNGMPKEVQGMKPVDKSGITMTTAAGDVLQVGGDVKQQLTKPNIGKQQEVASRAEYTLANLDAIEAKVKPEYFTYAGQFKQWAASKASKAGVKMSPEVKEFVQARRNLKNEVEQEFNAYRKEITGAAAAIQELEMLRESFINMDLSYEEFQAAFNQYKEKTKRALRISRKLLREGLTVGSKEYGKKHDLAWATGADDDPDLRGDELASQGLSDDEVLQKLREEGYQ